MYHLVRSIECIDRQTGQSVSISAYDPADDIWRALGKAGESISRTLDDLIDFDARPFLESIKEHADIQYHLERSPAGEDRECEEMPLKLRAIKVLAIDELFAGQPLAKQCWAAGYTEFTLFGKADYILIRVADVSYDLLLDNLSDDGKDYDEDDEDQVAEYERRFERAEAEIEAVKGRLARLGYDVYINVDPTAW